MFSLSIFCVLQNKLVNHYGQKQEIIFHLGKYLFLTGSDLFSENHRSTNHPKAFIFAKTACLLMSVLSLDCYEVFWGSCFLFKVHCVGFSNTNQIEYS